MERVIMRMGDGLYDGGSVSRSFHINHIRLLMLLDEDKFQIECLNKLYYFIVSRDGLEILGPDSMRVRSFYYMHDIIDPLKKLSSAEERRNYLKENRRALFLI